MARAKRIYILIIKVYKLFSFFFSSRCFPKEIEHMFFVFRSSDKNTRESLRELSCGAARVPTAFLGSFCEYRSTDYVQKQ